MKTNKEKPLRFILKFPLWDLRTFGANNTKVLPAEILGRATFRSRTGSTKWIQQLHLAARVPLWGSTRSPVGEQLLQRLGAGVEEGFLKRCVRRSPHLAPRIAALELTPTQPQCSSRRERTRTPLQEDRKTVEDVNTLTGTSLHKDGSI